VESIKNMWNRLKEFFLKKQFKVQDSFKTEALDPVKSCPELSIVMMKYKNTLSLSNDEVAKTRGYREVISLAESLLNHQSETVRQKVKKYQGLSYYQMKNFTESLRIFENLAIDTNASDNWFNVMTSAVLSKDFARGEQAFQNAESAIESENHQSGSVSLPYLNYYYICVLCDAKAYEKCFAPLDFLKNLYCALSITDDTFLHIRGVPFLSDTLDLAVNIFVFADEKQRGLKWLQELESGVDIDGKQQIEKVRKKLFV
jgi:tetratricopeptide (TPR) repeat protein